MPILDSMSKLSFADVMKQDMYRKMLQHEDLKDKLLNDPLLGDQVLAHLSRAAIPDKVAAKLPKNATFEKNLLAIDKDDPRRKILEGVQREMPNIIRNTPYGVNPTTSLVNTVQERMGASKEDIFKHIQKNSGMFGKDIAPFEGYEEWERKNPGMTSPLSSFFMGAGGQLASEGLQTAARGATAMPRLASILGGVGRALSFAPPIPGLGMGAKLLGAGLMTIPAMLATDAIRKGIVKSGYELSENPLTRTVEELAMGVPGFIGVNKLAGMGVARGAKALASMKEGFGGMAEGEQMNIAQPWIRTGVSKNDLSAYNKAWKENKALKEAEMYKMEQYSKLTDEDHDAILRGADPEQVKTARIKANMEKDIAETAAKKKELEDNIIEHANMLQERDPSLSHGDALALAKRKMMPTPEEASEDLKILHANGWGEVADKMTLQQRAEYASFIKDRNTATQTMLPAVRETFADMMPQAVPASKAPANLKSMRPTPNIILGQPVESLMLPRSTGARLNHTVEGTEQYLADVKSRQEQIAGGLPGTGKVIADEIAGVGDNPAIIRKTETMNFARGAADVILKVEEIGKSIVDSSVKTAEKIENLNSLATMAYDEVRNFARASKLSGHEAETLQLKTLAQMNERFKKALNPVTEEALRENTTAQMHTLADALGPESSPEHHANLVANSKIYKRALAEAKQDFAVIPEAERVPGSQRMDAWWKRYKGVLPNDILKKTALGIAALVPVTALLGGSEAEAAPIPGVTGRSILPSMVDMIRKSGKPVEQMVAKMFEDGHGSPVLTADGHGVQQMMRGYSYAPADARVFPKTPYMSKIDHILSPHTRGEIHFDARDANGERLPHNAAVELGDRSQVANANIEATLRAVKNILTDNGITGDLTEISNATLPLVQKYHEAVNLHAPYYQARIKMFDDVLEGRFRSAADSKLANLSKQLKLAKKDISQLDPEDQAYFKLINDEKAKAADELAKLQPTIKDFQTEHDVIMKDLARRFSTSRVALAVDGTGMSDADPWLRGMLSPAERKAAAEIKAINQLYAVRMQETGHQIIAGDYMHHPAHPSVNYSDSLKALDKISGDGAEAMRLVNFFHRSAGSRLMIPDTGYIMAKYVPDAAKRIEISDFWKMGKDGGWDATRRQMQALGGYDGALKLLDDLRTAFDPMDVGTGGKWLNRYAAFEVARLLTLSPSVSFKHALKLMGNWSIFPSGTSAAATGENISLFSRQIAQDLAGDAFKGKDLVADLGKAYTNQSHIYAAVSDMAPYELPTNVYDKFISKWNELGSAAVNGVERWDRGQTFMSAMLMASKKGMTPVQARYALMDSVLKVNFLTGPNNPKWLKDPFIRTMMLFQGTPFKILEQRAMLAYQAGKDVSNTLKLLNQLRKDVKTGEERFSMHMLMDELTRSKDIYGTPYTSQFLKQMMVLGTVLYGGSKVFDSNLWGHAIHIPGMQMGERGVQLGVNPIISAAYKTVKDIGKEGEDEFWKSRFFNNWLGQTGFPAIAHKMARLNNDDIPAMYRDSKLSYLFGVPRLKEH